MFDFGHSFADEVLVARARDGDADAMHDLLAALRPAIFRFCRFRLSSYGNATDASEDATQETCLAVAAVLPAYQDQGLPFRAWVYAIAAHKVADSQRRHGRAAALVDAFPEQVEKSLTPEESAIASVEFRTALALTHQLPTKMREVLLRRASGITAKKVGEDLGMTPGAVNVTHHRAVLKLRQLVESSEEYRELFSSFLGAVSLPVADSVPTTAAGKPSRMGRAA